jgi:hypothetical protein
MTLGFAFAAIAMQLPASIPGQLYVPNDGRPHAGVVVLRDEGSEGAAIAEREARGLADQGFVSLALDLSADLSQVYEAFRWLRTSSYVGRRPTAVYGVGRGAEAALGFSVYVSERAGLMTPAAVVLHAPVDRLGEAGWNWQGSALGFAPGRELRLDRTSFSLFVSHGVLDPVVAVSASYHLEESLRAEGASTQSVVHPRIGIDAPTGAEGAPSFARAEFHYFEGQGHVLAPLQDEARLGAMVRFLKHFLGE